ncbi:MAG: tRNA (adenosine(37)-N6)-threonylcarbamoyltransferase complex transferase subunit TsaD [Chitinophagaceae bacterium]
MALILGIESSCDDTSVGICQEGKIISNIISTQPIHSLYGGVVPELASRAHIKNILPIVEESIKKANINLQAIDAIAFTQSPGLIGSLLVGSSFAKSLAMCLEKPLIAVNHLEAHILSPMIESNLNPPYLCLLVSGGHTQIVCCKSAIEMELIGNTLDDAAGEAFDKSARLLGLPYPGGVLIDKLAKEGNPLAYTFPKPKITNFNYSFSGLKTAIFYFINNQIAKDKDFVEKNKSDICASIQHTIIEILLDKFLQAAKQYHIQKLSIAGGVSANSYLRKKVFEKAQEKQYQIYIPELQFCTDNGGMIAFAGYQKYLHHDFASLSIFT